ncbi:MAG: ABC transporter substrate-binding protein [bacterium]|nr:ABC transporter substrate-binding protein [bacterium]MDY4100479.1 ABC transporter substrate-binding protein [Lachnospiraceae bacterium]
MKKKVFAILLTAALVLGLAGCQSKNETDQTVSNTAESSEETTDDASKGGAQETDGLKKIKIGVISTGDSYVIEFGNAALNKGYIDEELKNAGYEAEFVGFASGVEISEAYAAGQVDAMFIGDFPLLTLSGSGVDVDIFATLNGQQQYGLLAGNDSIQSEKDLEGKKIQYIVGTTVSYSWSYYAKAKNIDTNKVETVNSGDTSLLASGDADANYTGLSTAYMYEQNGLGKVVADTFDTPEATTQFFAATNPTFGQENEGAIVAIIKALNHAYEDAKTDAEGTYEVLATSFIPKELVEKAYSFDTTFAYFNPELTDATAEKLTREKDYLKEIGYLQQDVDVNALLNTSYYEKAIQ